MSERMRFPMSLLVSVLATVPCTSLVYAINIVLLERTDRSGFSVDLSEVAQSGLPLIALGTLLGLPILAILERHSQDRNAIHPLVAGLLFAASYGVFGVVSMGTRAIAGLPFEPLWLGALPSIGLCHGLFLWFGAFSQRGTALTDRLFGVRA